MFSMYHVLRKKLFSTKQFDQARGGILIKNGQCILWNESGHHISMCNVKANLYKLGVIDKKKPYNLLYL
jgi:hypothetical protein